MPPQPGGRKERARRTPPAHPTPTVAGCPEPPAQVRARGPPRPPSPAPAAGTGTHHSDSRSHSWSRAKSKLSMVGGVSAAVAEAWAARALQRKAPLKVHPGRTGAAAARPPASPRVGAPGAPRPRLRAGRPGGSGRRTHPLAGSRAGTLRRQRRARRAAAAPPPPAPAPPPSLAAARPAAAAAAAAVLCARPSFSSGRRVCAGEAEERARAVSPACRARPARPPRAASRGPAAFAGRASRPPAASRLPGPRQPRPAAGLRAPAKRKAAARSGGGCGAGLGLPHLLSLSLANCARSFPICTHFFWGPEFT